MKITIAAGACASVFWVIEPNFVSTGQIQSLNREK